MKTIFETLRRCVEQGEDLMLVSIIGSTGSSPRGKGAQMLVSEAGRLCGTIGGGNVEFLAEKTARELLREGRSDGRFFPLHPGAEDIGMVCGGEVDVWMQFVSAADRRWQQLAKEVLDRLEKRNSGWLVLKTDGSFPYLADVCPEGESLALPLPIGERVIIFGGGHCSQALVPILKSVGFRVTVMECREAFASRELFPDAEQIICGDYSKISSYLTLEPEDYVVVLTSGHAFDLEVEEQVLRHQLAYVGVIGSRKKTEVVNRELLRRGISEAALRGVHTPIGTPIRAVTPAEIAVSIAGEMILERALRREAAGEEISHGCPMHE